MPERPATTTSLQEALLAWYARHGRDLPWRSTHDPYHILVAEIMLQQTQVERVLPKYAEFLEAFPTLADLAQASRGEVIRRWAPLGYNLRAVRLHQMAQQVVARWSGNFPRTLEEMLQLKGIGRYTAGALACFAFGQPVAFLDTNIRRVLGRSLAGLSFPTPRNDTSILALAHHALPWEDSNAWHQGLMDLGATVCTRARPACAQCPLQAWCLARPVLFAAGPPDERRPLSVQEARVAYRTQSKYPGSRRYYRGKIVGALRRLREDESMSLETLGREVKVDFQAEDGPWLVGLVEALAKDGLVALAGSEDGAGDWRVALP